MVQVLGHVSIVILQKKSFAVGSPWQRRRLEFGSRIQGVGSRWLADPEDPQTFRMKKGAPRLFFHGHLVMSQNPGTQIVKWYPKIAGECDSDRFWPTPL